MPVRLTELTDPSRKGVAAVTSSPDGRTVATGDYYGGTFLWNVATGERTRTITSPGPVVWVVAFSPDLRLMAITCCTYGWQEREDLRHGVGPDTFPLQSVRYSRDGRTMVADATGNSHLWKLN